MLKENCFIERGNNPLLSDWGHGPTRLKYKYESELNNEIKTYKMSKEELEEYLSKYK